MENDVALDAAAPDVTIRPNWYAPRPSTRSALSSSTEGSYPDWRQPLSKASESLRQLVRVLKEVSEADSELDYQQLDEVDYALPQSGIALEFHAPPESHAQQHVPDPPQSRTPAQVYVPPQSHAQFHSPALPQLRVPPQSHAPPHLHIPLPSHVPSHFDIPPHCDSPTYNDSQVCSSSALEAEDIPGSSGTPSEIHVYDVPPVHLTEVQAATTPQHNSPCRTLHYVLRSSDAEKDATDQRNSLFTKLCEVAVAQGQDNAMLMSFLDEFNGYLKQREDELANMRALLQRKDDKISRMKESLRMRQSKINESRKLAQQTSDEIDEQRNLIFTLTLELTQAQVRAQAESSLGTSNLEGSESFLGYVLRQRDKEIAQMEEELALLREHAAKTACFSPGAASTAASSKESDLSEKLSQARTIQLQQEAEIRDLRLKLDYKDQELGSMTVHLDAASRELAQVRDGLRKTATTTAGSTKTHDWDQTDPLEFSHSNVLELSDEDSSRDISELIKATEAV